MTDLKNTNNPSPEDIKKAANPGLENTEKNIKGNTAKDTDIVNEIDSDGSASAFEATENGEDDGYDNKFSRRNK